MIPLKANQKFLRGDEAVSPVIAVILMVAITVVLSATVYVWVSGFGGNHNQPANTIALASNAPITSAGYKSFTVTAATASLRWDDMTITIDGQTLALAPTTAMVDDDEDEATPDVEQAISCATNDATKAVVCQGADRKAGTDLVQAGDELRVPATAGQTLRILDTEANSVILTVMLG